MKNSADKVCSNYDKFVVYQTNLQVSKNRLSSLEAISNALQVDVAIVNETGLRKNDKFHMGEHIVASNL